MQVRRGAPRLRHTIPVQGQDTLTPARPRPAGQRWRAGGARASPRHRYSGLRGAAGHRDEEVRPTAPVAPRPRKLSLTQLSTPADMATYSWHSEVRDDEGHCSASSPHGRSRLPRAASGAASDVRAPYVPRRRTPARGSRPRGVAAGLDGGAAPGGACGTASRCGAARPTWRGLQAARSAPLSAPGLRACPRPPPVPPQPHPRPLAPPRGLRRRVGAAREVRAERPPGLHWVRAGVSGTASSDDMGSIFGNCEKNKSFE